MRLCVLLVLPQVSASKHTSDLTAQIAALKVSSEAAAREVERLALDQAAAVRVEAEKLKTVTEALRMSEAARAAMPAARPDNGRVVVHVTTTDLSELLVLVNRAAVPTIYDLGGQHLQDCGNYSLHIDTSHVTMRNGTILLGVSQAQTRSSLCIRGTDVELEDIVIVGGHVGLVIEPGAAVSLQSCEVKGAYIGVLVGGTTLQQTTCGLSPTTRTSTLTADTLTVSGCGKGSGLTVSIGANVKLIRSTFSGGEGHGVIVYGNARSQLTAVHLESFDNVGLGMSVQSGACAKLTHCSLEGNTEGSLLVSGLGSRALLRGCTLDDLAVLTEGGAMDMEWSG